MRVMKKLTRKCWAVLFCLLMILSFSACSSVKPLILEDDLCTIPDENIQFTIPENSFAFSQGTSAFLGDWTLAGIADPLATLNEYKEMNILAHVVSMGGKNNIYITKKQSSLSSEIFNLTESGDEGMALIKEDLFSMNETEGFEASVDEATFGGIRFASADVRYTPEENQGEFLHEFCYVTIINGVSYTFDAFTKGTELTEDQKIYLDQFMNTIVFTNILSGEMELTTKELLMLFIPMFLVLALIIFFIVNGITRKKKTLREKNELTEKLSEYRLRKKKEQEEDPNHPEPKTLFVNKTIHTDAAIQKFSYFHAYKKHPLIIPAYIITGIVSAVLGFSLFSDMDNILWAILFIAAGVYCVVKVFTMPGSTYKVLQRVYKKLPNRVALYAFREEDFRLSGLQATGVFPYFQLSSVYESKDMFYLYFGEDNAYFLDKNTFSFGELADFRAFIKEKMGKKFKRRLF